VSKGLEFAKKLEEQLSCYQDICLFRT